MRKVTLDLVMRAYRATGRPVRLVAGVAPLCGDCAGCRAYSSCLVIETIGGNA